MRSPFVIEMDVRPFKSLEDLVEQVAQYVIANNLYRKGNDFYHFSEATIAKMNSMDSRWAGAIEGGYAFLDEPDKKDGMVRLYIDNCNPKWGFGEKEGGGLWVDYC
jgi:hypothetical protein